MTRERRDRIEEIANEVARLRSELLGMRLEEIHELPLICEKFRYESSREHIVEIRKATDLFSQGLCELGY